MTEALRLLATIAAEIQRPHGLDDLLQLIVEGAAKLTGVRRASIRLLEPSGQRLMAVCRAGTPLHLNPNEPFTVGQGFMGWIVAQVAPIRSGDAERDPRFALRPGMKTRIGSFLGVPLTVGTTCLGVISVVDPNADAFFELHEQLLTTLAAICAPHVEVARLQRLATHDPLTGALNRHGLEEALPETTQLEEGAHLSVAIVDLDHFKRINDTLGHAMGDEVLREVARLIAASVRQGDAVIRYGGEEFLLFFPDTALAAATAIAERARESIQRAEFALGDTSVKVTVSIGVAQLRPHEERDQVIQRADGALYEAKRGGRNRVEVAADPE